MMRHIVHRAIPIVHLLLSELTNHPSLDVVLYYLVIYPELALFDQTLLDIIFDFNDLRAIILQDVRILDERILEP